MHENVYILRVMFAGSVDMWAVKAHSQEEAVLKYRRKMQEWGIDATDAKVHIYFVSDEISLFHSYEV
jgi:hypothetical protein